MLAKIADGYLRMSSMPAHWMIEKASLAYMNHDRDLVHVRSFGSVL